MKIIAATKNPGKLGEYRRLLGALPVVLEDLSAHPAVRLPPESGDTYRENAARKAGAAARALVLPAFGEDSGLEVDALGGEPGLRSARFASPGGDSKRNIAELLRRMKGVRGEKRSARFKAVVVLVHPSGSGEEAWKEAVFEGVFPGYISERPEGTGGFGYDPVFISPAHGRTVALLREEEKDAVSHRAAAARAMAEYITAHLLRPAPADPAEP
jgi:XTP/dITP diphosphohydrolase